MSPHESDVVEKLIRGAFHHTLGEMGLENVQPSFRVDYERLQKAHDAIHEFLYIGSLTYPSGVETDFEWHSKTAFFLYQWEAFHHAHRSLIEALCGYYNVAFTLLRVTLELLGKGALCECLAHQKFRQDAQVLQLNSKGAELLKWLQAIFAAKPEVEEKLEQVSAGIYDKVGPFIEAQGYLVTFKTIIRQLHQWGILVPLSDPVDVIYTRIYGRLSSDVHVIPERTDIGRRLMGEKVEVFEQELLPDTLHEYANQLHQIMDFAIVMELNILADLITASDEVKGVLKNRLHSMEQLGLVHSLKRVHDLIGA